MSSQAIIVPFLGPDIMTISKTLEDIMEDVRTGGNEHINQFHLDHIPDDLAHSARNHGAGESQENNTVRITKHLAIDFETLEDIPALKRGVLKGLDQIE